MPPTAPATPPPWAELATDVLDRLFSSAVGPGQLDLHQLLTATSACRAWRQRLAHVWRLRLTCAAHCDVRALRLCPAVSEVVAEVGDDVDLSGDGEFRVHHQMIGQLPFALTVLPRLAELLIYPDWHTQCSRFGEDDVAHERGQVAAETLVRSVCDARAVGLLAELRCVTHGGHICKCNYFWNGPLQAVTEWTEELREEYHEAKRRCHCASMLRHMPTANVFLYGVSHGLCLSEDKVLEEFERRGVSLADPWLPSSYASQPAGGWRRVGVEMEYERVLDVQRRWSRPITWCEAFALCFEWQTLRPSNRVDEKEVFVDDDDAARWPEYIMHVLMETAGAAGRELLQRPELANELVEVDADGNQVTEAADFFRALLAREVEFRAAGGAEAMAGGSEDSE